MTPDRHTFYHSQPVTWPTVMKVNIGTNIKQRWTRTTT